MDNKQSFSLSEASAEDTQVFKDGVEEILNKHSLHLNLVIEKKPISIKSPDGKDSTVFVDQPTLFVQKKTLIDIVSPLSEEMTNESDKTA